MRRKIYLLLVLAFVVRLYSVWHWRRVNTESGDQSEYIALAQNIRFHTAFSYGEPHPWGAPGHLNTAGPFVPTAARAPLYPITIAALWWSERPPLLETRLLQLILGLTTVLLTYLIATREFGRGVGFIAGIGMAVFPLSCYMTAFILSDTLFTFLLTLGTWLWGGRRPFLAGVMLGLAALTRPTLLPFLFLLVLFTCFRSQQRAFIGKLVLAAILVIAPWTVRNYIAFHKLIPIATLGWGCHLFYGTLDIPKESPKKWQIIRADPTLSGIIEATKNETEAEGVMMTVALRRIQKAPFQWAVKRVIQSYRLFIDQGGYTYSRSPLPPLATKIIFIIGSILFWALAVVGVIKERKRWRQLGYLLSFPIYFVIVQIPMLALIRYSLPLIPPMMVFVAVVISSAIFRMRTYLVRNGSNQSTKSLL